jgi:hypothetical protein
MRVIKGVSPIEANSLAELNSRDVPADLLNADGERKKKSSAA